jgi:4-oxalocrotonate tautomerase
MPLVRVDVPRGKSAEYRRAIGEEIYTAMVDVLNVPKDDRFQVIAEHDENALVIDPTYLGIQRTKDAILIQITLNDGRSVEKKRAFYKALADGLHQRVGLRREDVFVNLVEVKKENWSFGDGEAQYAP